MVDGSLLHERYTALMNGEKAVPLDYEQLQAAAKEHLSTGEYDYLTGGAGTEATIDANRTGFDRYRIITRVLRDVSDRSLETTLFGRDIAAPVVLAPIGTQRTFHEEGEVASARAAAELNVPFVLSTGSSRTIEDVAEASGDSPRLFQLYWSEDWEIAESFVKRADAAGYDGIMLTVDSQLPTWRVSTLENAYSRRNDAPKAVFESDPVVKQRAAESEHSLREYVQREQTLGTDQSLTWEDLDVLCEWTDLPIVLKGITTGADARQASELGIDGIVVSTHGGRQIDGGAGALDQLSDVVDAVGEETTVLMGSGIRSGADVFKALAIGADAVHFGRPYIYGLTIAGQRGVYETTLNCLAELESVMGLSGHRSVDQVTRESVVDAPTC